MAIPIWPTTLPQSPQKGFTESIGANIIRSPMDAGPAKMRYRGKSPNQMNLSFIMTTAQVDTLETFVNDTLKGVKRFSFKHPRYAGQQNQPTVEVRIVPQNGGQSYQLQYMAPGYWTVTTQFEILP